MLKRFTVTCGSARLAGEQRGVGESVIFLHAGVADRRMFRSQLQALGASHRTVAYDRRGFGETTTPNEPFAHVEDLAQVMAHLSIAKTRLVGCSQGGAIALAFALAHPDAVTGMVLISTAISGAPEPAIPPHLKPIVDAYHAADEAGDPEALNDIEAHVWLDGPGEDAGRVSGATRELFLEMNAYALAHRELSEERKLDSVYERIADVTVPVLLIGGRLDFPHVHEQHAHLEAHLPHVTSCMIENAAHLPSMEHPEAVNKRLLAFCQAT